MVTLERERGEADKEHGRQLYALRSELETRAGHLERELGQQRDTHEAQLRGLQVELTDAKQSAATSFERTHHLEQKLTAASSSSAALKVAVEALRSESSKFRARAGELEAELEQQREAYESQLEELQTAVEAEQQQRTLALQKRETASPRQVGRSQTGWLVPRSVVGMSLLALAITIAVLIVAGALNVSLA